MIKKLYGKEIRFKEEILILSQNTSSYTNCIKEWFFYPVWLVNYSNVRNFSSHKCLCGTNIKNYYFMKNIHNDNIVMVGKDCSKKCNFMSDELLKRICRTERFRQKLKKDPTVKSNYIKCRFCKLLCIEKKKKSYYCDMCVVNNQDDPNMPIKIKECNICEKEFKCKKDETKKDKCKICFIEFMNQMTTRKCIYFKKCGNIYKLKRKDKKWKLKCSTCFKST